DLTRGQHMLAVGGATLPHHSRDRVDIRPTARGLPRTHKIARRLQFVLRGYAAVRPAGRDMIEDIGRLYGLRYSKPFEPGLAGDNVMEKRHVDRVLFRLCSAAVQHDTDAELGHEVSRRLAHNQSVRVALRAFQQLAIHFSQLLAIAVSYENVAMHFVLVMDRAERVNRR